MRSARIVALLLAILPLATARGGVVINEIYYNAPDDLRDVQWIELYDDSDQPANLSGWTLDDGALYRFAEGDSLKANGYLVVALNLAQFKKNYHSDAIGPLKRPIKRSGEKITLRNSQGDTIDVIRYKDGDPWPVSPDGYSSSLERISPSASGEDSANWAASPLPADASKPSGTPGAKNAAFSESLPPVISDATADPDDPSPDASIHISAKANDGKVIKTVNLRYRIVADEVESDEIVAPMTLDAATGRYQGEIPGQDDGVLIRYRIEAIDESGARRLYPAEGDLRPAFSLYVHKSWPPAKISLGYLLMDISDKSHPKKARPRPPMFMGGPNGIPGGPQAGPPPNDSQAGPPPNGPQAPGGEMPNGPEYNPFMQDRETEAPRPPRGSSALIYVDSKTRKPRAFDFINVTPREGERGYIVHLHKDNALDGMTAVSFVFEGSEPFLMAEALAYDVFRRAGVPAPDTDFVRLWEDGRLVGYHLVVERPNRSFLRRNKINDKGDLFKIRWFEQGVIGQHEKKTNTQTDHEELLAILKSLKNAKGEAQWKVIKDNFDVDEVASFFAVNMALSHWDGFFNNHFVYYDSGDTKKWMMFPWDQDKTWGYYDGMPDKSVFYTLPLTFGMEGAKPPGASSKRRPPMNGMPNGGNPYGGPPGGPDGGQIIIMRPDGPNETNPNGGPPSGPQGGPNGGQMFIGPPGGQNGENPFGDDIFNNDVPWWRPGGYFSKPLLANPEFRKIFKARLKEIVQNIYVKEIYYPLIDEMTNRLREDSEIRAKFRRNGFMMDPDGIDDASHRFKTHLTKRRQFIVDQLNGKAGSKPAKKSAAKGKKTSRH